MADAPFPLDQPSPQTAVNLSRLTGMPPLSPEAQQVGRALADVARVTSIPLREPSYSRPTFWSKPLLEMRARIIPPLTDWTPYITLQSGLANFPAGFSATVQYFIATSVVDPATSGVTWRFLYQGGIMDVNQFVLVPGIDLNVERSAAVPNPWPSQVRRIAQIIMNGEQFVLQVKNTSGVNQRALAALSGWYWPNTPTQDRGNMEIGAHNDDAARTVGSNSYDTGH